jgi:reactive intermediate/imine deaminase
MVPGAPDPCAPYSHAVERDGWVFVTGQMPNDPAAPGAPLPEGVAAQTDAVMRNLTVVLAHLGLTLDDVVQARCFLTEFARDYAAFNAAYAAHFAPGRLPARTTVGVTGLALGALVEIDFVARRRGPAAAPPP